MPLLTLSLGWSGVECENHVDSKATRTPCSLRGSWLFDDGTVLLIVRHALIMERGDIGRSVLDVRSVRDNYQVLYYELRMHRYDYKDLANPQVANTECIWLRRYGFGKGSLSLAHTKKCRDPQTNTLEWRYITRAGSFEGMQCPTGSTRDSSRFLARKAEVTKRYQRLQFASRKRESLE